MTDFHIRPDCRLCGMNPFIPVLLAIGLIVLGSFFSVAFLEYCCAVAVLGITVWGIRELYKGRSFP